MCINLFLNRALILLTSILSKGLLLEKEGADDSLHLLAYLSFVHLHMVTILTAFAFSVTVGGIFVFFKSVYVITFIDGIRVVRLIVLNLILFLQFFHHIISYALLLSFKVGFFLRHRLQIVA